MGLSAGGAQVERLLRTGLPCHKGYNAGHTCIPNDVNVVVDNVIRTWLAITVEYQRMDHDGLGETFGR